MEEALQEQKRLKDKMDDDSKTFRILQDELHSLRVINFSKCSNIALYFYSSILENLRSNTAREHKTQIGEWRSNRKVDEAKAG